MTTERETGSAQTVLINAVIEKAVPALIIAREALDRFHAMMRSKDEARLDPWIAMAADTKLAAGAEADKDAIAVAIATPWSSGQVEGKINRRKAIKRFSIMTNLMHFGMTIVGLPYSHPGQGTIDEIVVVAPYGATTIAGSDGSRHPSEIELAGSRHQGMLVATTAAKLFD
ncbi:hypothetical protein [Novosphingobium sp. HR1a]|uniref:hypothetical protein n=1 Tax=Novosphingobium TaxID=165696 RepID=UPI0020039242|nr:hypothetical protein [Novosphingobium sp. HR1a]